MMDKIFWDFWFYTKFSFLQKWSEAWLLAPPNPQLPPRPPPPPPHALSVYDRCILNGRA